MTLGEELLVQFLGVAERADPVGVVGSLCGNNRLTQH